MTLKGDRKMLKKIINKDIKLTIAQGRRVRLRSEIKKSKTKTRWLSALARIA